MEKKEYTAFISYSHDDTYLADTLQKKLEHFYIPVALREANPDIPATVRPIFKDDTDLTPGTLSDRISNALDNSDFLIVICSIHSAQSEWVSKEVEHFIRAGRSSRIIPVVVGDMADGSSIDRYMPEALRALKGDDQLLWIDLRAEGIDRTVVKIIAVILNVSFDSLWQRHTRERRRRMRRRVCLCSVFAVIAAGITLFGVTQCSRLKRNEFTAMQNDAATQAQKLTAGGNPIEALRLLTADEGRLLEPYNGNIDHALRDALTWYYTPGWVCVATGSMPVYRPYPDGFDITADNILCFSDSSYVTHQANTLTISSYSGTADPVTITRAATETIADAEITPDGALLAYRYYTGDSTSTIAVLDTRSLESVYNIDTPASFMSVSYGLAPDGSRLLTAIDGILEVTDLATGETLHRVQRKEGEDTAAWISVLSDSLAELRTLSGTVIYDYVAGTPTITHPLAMPSVYALSDHENKEITIVDAEGNSTTFRYNGPEKGAFNLPVVYAISADGDKFATLTPDDRIEIRTIANDRLITTLEKPYDYLPMIAFNNDGTRVTVVGNDIVSVFDILSGKEITHTDINEGYVFDITPDGSTLYMTDGNGKFFTRSMTDNAVTELDLGEREIYPNYDGLLYAAVSPDDDSLLEIWVPGADKPSKTIKLNDELLSIYTLSFSPDNEYIAILHTNPDPDPASSFFYIVSVISLTDGVTVAKYRNHRFDIDSFITFTKYNLVSANRISPARTSLTFDLWRDYSWVKSAALSIITDPDK